MNNPMQEPWQAVLEGIEADILSEIDQVATFILDAQKDFHAGLIEYKGANNLVSFVDREAERMLFDCCGKLIPGSGFIGEEGGSTRPDAEYRWIIDPLDGTTNFIHGVPAYAISLALQYQQKTVFGVVRDVPRGETFTAKLGHGAFLGKQRLSVSSTKSLPQALLSMGFPYPDSGVALDDYLAVLNSFLQSCHGMRRFGAAALDLAWVACGRFDGFYEMGLQAWDVAAAALMIAEAGGRVTDFSGTDNFVFGRQIVAGNPSVQQEMLLVIAKHYPH